MGILSWIVLGIVAGSVATWVMPGPDRLRIGGTIGLGVSGAVVGGFLGTALGFGSVADFDFGSLLTAIIGSLVVLFCYRTYSMRAMA